MSTEYTFDRRIKSPALCAEFLEKHCDVNHAVVDGDYGQVYVKLNRPLSIKEAADIVWSYHDPNLRVQVLNKKKNSLGRKITTSGVLTAAELTKNKRGKIVSDRASSIAKAVEPLQLKLWRNAVVAALKALDLKDGKFHPIKKGTKLYKKVREIYDKSLIANKDNLKERKQEIATLRAHLARYDPIDRPRVTAAHKWPDDSLCKSPRKKKIPTPKKGKKATPKKGKKATPKKGKKATPKKATPKKATPKKATPKKATPKKATPKSSPKHRHSSRERKAPVHYS